MSNFTKLMAQAAAGAAGGGDFYDYTIDNSARLEGNNYLYRTYGGNTKTFTLSFWCKRAPGNGNTPGYFHAITGGGYYSPGGFYFLLWPNTSAGGRWISQDDPAYESIFNDPSNTGRDFSAWYHYVFAFDSTQATSTDRMKVWVNGVQQPWTGTYPPLNYNIPQFSGTMYIARDSSTGQAVQFAGGGNSYGYLAEMAITDGQYYSASDFGEFKNGVWIPKDLSGLTFGTKGFWLDFKDSSNFGNDVSGNNLDFTAVGFQTHDQMLDTPTLNYPTLQVPFSTGATTYSEGNLVAQQDSAAAKHTRASFALPTTGKWYWEVQYIDARSFDPPLTAFGIGVSDNDGIGDYGYSKGANIGVSAASTTVYSYQDGGYTPGDNITLSNGVQAGDWFGIAYDADTRKMWLWSQRDNAWLASGNPSAGTNPWKTLTALSAGQDYYPILFTQTNDSGRWSKFGVNFGQQSFVGTAPTGFLQLNATNLPEPSIGPNTSTQSDDHFNTVLYTGNGSSQNITGFGFNPDMVWHKGRSVAYSHSIVDVIRGNSNVMFTNSTDAEQNPGAQLDLITDGATVTYRSANLANNQSGATYVIWGWKGNGSGVSNSDGTITSTVSANTNAGFSIVGYTGNGTTNQTVGHGLSQTPEVTIIKKRSAGGNNWSVFHDDVCTFNSTVLWLDTADALVSENEHIKGLSSSTFTIGTRNAVNHSANTFIAYIFHSVEGFSKFGSYTGNGSTDGPFVYTGFRPAFILWKSSSAAYGWVILDTARDPYNAADTQIYPWSSGAESSDATYNCDILSNGFKIRNSNAVQNQSSATYIYMAFAETPFKYANAR